MMMMINNDNITVFKCCPPVYKASCMVIGYNPMLWLVGVDRDT